MVWEDESSRLNMNMLLIADTAVPGGGRTLLMSLPGMTEDVADAILRPDGPGRRTPRVWR